MSSFKQVLDQYDKLLPVGTSISYVEAERRAGEFLTAMSLVTSWKHDFSKQHIKFLSIQTAVYAQELAKGVAKTVTENKITAESSSMYTEAREQLENVENDISYLKAMYEVFNNAHIFYRNLSRSDNG